MNSTIENDKAKIKKPRVFLAGRGFDERLQDSACSDIDLSKALEGLGAESIITSADYKNTNFYAELKKDLIQNKFKKNDILFIDNVSYFKLPSLLKLIKKFALKKNSGSIVILFREQFDCVFPKSRVSKRAAAAIENAFLKGRLRCAACNAELAKEYARQLLVL